jgi:demethylmenaquinone methyltransferase/2-methoxy-6-polyprenyl-1,4-benzoquinol methylase
MEDIRSLIQQQIAYYQARASEYDEWFLRQGRYDRGLEFNQQWFDEVEQVRNSLTRFKPHGNVLELACGTGLWTQQLLYHARQITAVDAAAEVLELNRRRLLSSKVKYIQTNIFNWEPEEQYDAVFFSFWLSHVPSEYFEQFWQTVRQALKSEGRVFFVDSKYEPTSTARDHHLGEAHAGIVKRRLNDGREYQVVKIFYERVPLEKRLSQLGWSFSIQETQKYFLFGHGKFGSTKEPA